MKLKQSLLIDRRINSRSSFLVLAIYRIQHYLYQHNYSFFLKLAGGGQIYDIFLTWYRCTDFVQSCSW